MIHTSILSSMSVQHKCRPCQKQPKIMFDSKWITKLNDYLSARAKGPISARGTVAGICIKTEMPILSYFFFLYPYRQSSLFFRSIPRQKFVANIARATTHVYESKKVSRTMESQLAAPSQRFARLQDWKKKLRNSVKVKKLSFELKMHLKFTTAHCHCL